MTTASDAPLPGVDQGSGTTVVFLHGYPLNHAMWLPQLKSLSGEHRVVLLDLPGYDLAQSWQVPNSLEGFAESVHRTIAARVTSPAVVVGHSFGGYVALQWIHMHPEMFRGLVLTNTRSAADSPEAKEKRQATIRRLRAPGQFLDVEETVRGLVAPATWQRGGPVVEQVRGMVRGTPTQTIRSTLRAIADRSDLTPVLSTIHVPTLVIWGEEDQLIPPTQSQSMVPLIAQGSGVGIPAAGHLPSLEAPGSFAVAVQNFLQKVPAP